MTNIRRQKNKNKPYVQLFRENFQIPTLSLEAKGLWAYLMSLPEDWRINVKHLSRTFGDPSCGKFRSGKERIRRILQELKDHKLCVFEQERVDGRWTTGDYVVFDDEIEFKKYLPDTAQASPVERDPAEPSPYKEKRLQKNNSTKKDIPNGISKEVGEVSPPDPNSKNTYECAPVSSGTTHSCVVGIRTAEQSNTKNRTNIKKKKDIPIGISKEVGEVSPPDPKNKIKYGDFVFLSDDEYEKLHERLGSQHRTKYIQKLNAYIGSRGKRYKSHYHTIIQWVIADEEKKNPQTTKPIRSKAKAVFIDGTKILGKP